jgi:hypothetical protein
MDDYSFVYRERCMSFIYLKKADASLFSVPYNISVLRRQELKKMSNNLQLDT